MPGLEDVAAGCVVQLHDPGRIAAHAAGGLDGWLEALEHRLERLGCAQPRLYLQVPHAAAEDALARRGYAARVEYGMVYTGTPPPPPPGLTLHRVESDADWEAKINLHGECPDGPDGHATSPARWVTLERRKVEAGTLEMFLMLADGHVRGSLGFAPCAEIARLKNLVVHPAYRRQRVASRGLQLLCRLAAARGKRGLGAFVIPDPGRERLYARCGFRYLTEQTEWLRSARVAARADDPSLLPQMAPA
jgi:GNAT superfamily N-acetyltransferase